MYQSRDEIRRVYLTVWQKLQQGKILEPMEAVIAQVIELHPEYHALLDKGEAVNQQEFTPEAGQSNPFLHMGMHIALHEQTSTNRPQGIQQIHQQLCAKSGQHNAEHAMMECLGQVLWQAQRDQAEPDENMYLECLRKLL
jgi:hypothetical protein